MRLESQMTLLVLAVRCAADEALLQQTFQAGALLTKALLDADQRL